MVKIMVMPSNDYGGDDYGDGGDGHTQESLFSHCDRVFGKKKKKLGTILYTFYQTLKFKATIFFSKTPFFFFFDTSNQIPKCALGGLQF